MSLLTLSPGTIWFSEFIVIKFRSFVCVGFAFGRGSVYNSKSSFKMLNETHLGMKTSTIQIKEINFC